MWTEKLQHFNIRLYMYDIYVSCDSFLSQSQEKM